MIPPAEMAIWDAAYEDAYGPQKVVHYGAEMQKVLSRRPERRWRNMYRAAEPLPDELSPGCTRLDDFHYLGRGIYGCIQRAEQAALHWIQVCPTDTWIESREIL